MSDDSGQRQMWPYWVGLVMFPLQIAVSVNNLVVFGATPGRILFIVIAVLGIGVVLATLWAHYRKRR